MYILSNHRDLKKNNQIPDPVHEPMDVILETTSIIK